MIAAAVVTTFPDTSWDIYSKAMLKSFTAYWPKEIPLLIQVDDDLLAPDIGRLLRPQDALSIGWSKDHKDFVDRNKGRDDPVEYRKQAVRFCHKIFAIKRALEATQAAQDFKPRYLIWVDADVITTRQVTMDDIVKCLPKEGDTVSYLGRKDWDHSECGWLAFDLENDGQQVISDMYIHYLNDSVFEFKQWHDSFIWDAVLSKYKITNLTQDKPGRDIWQYSPMAGWSVHHKGPVAKETLACIPAPAPKGGGLKIQTRNAIPHEDICAQIAANQKLIKNWIRPCARTDEEIVIVSAGPMLIAEDVLKEKGRIIAVKHALKPLKKAGIKPWGCILLDPREHVECFVEDPDTDVIWFVASQVNPRVTMRLLAHGCNVWGYHASVGAGEDDLIRKQEYAIVGGGSATATRGLFLLNHLGFKNFKLYGYDLCNPDKPDMNERDDLGQPKHFEMSIGMKDVDFEMKRNFFSEPQLMAQFEEMQELIKTRRFNLKAEGYGIIPFIIKCREIIDLRSHGRRLTLIGNNPPDYERMLGCSKKTRQPRLWIRWLSRWLLIRLKPSKASSLLMD